jgi:hypothetical protein
MVVLALAALILELRPKLFVHKVLTMMAILLPLLVLMFLLAVVHLRTVLLVIVLLLVVAPTAMVRVLLTQLCAVLVHILTVQRLSFVSIPVLASVPLLMAVHVQPLQEPIP